MEILSGSGCKGDPFGVLVLRLRERVDTAINIWIPVYVLDAMGSEWETW